MTNQTDPKLVAHTLVEIMSSTTMGYDVLYYDTLSKSLNKTIMDMRSLIVNIYDESLTDIIKNDPDALKRYLDLEEQLHKIFNIIIDKVMMPTQNGRLTPAFKSKILMEMRIVDILQELYLIFASLPTPTAITLDTYTSSTKSAMLRLSSMKDSLDSKWVVNNNEIESLAVAVTKTNSLLSENTSIAAGSVDNIQLDKSRITHSIKERQDDDLSTISAINYLDTPPDQETPEEITQKYKQLLSDIDTVIDTKIQASVDKYIKEAEEFATNALKALDPSAADEASGIPLRKFLNRLGEDNFYNGLFKISENTGELAKAIADNIGLNSLATLWNVYPELTCIIKWLLAKVCLSKEPLADISEYCGLLSKIERILEILDYTFSIKIIGNLNELFDSLLNQLAGQMIETIISMTSNAINAFINQLVKEIRNILKVDEKCLPLKCLPFEDLINEVLDLIEDKRNDILRWISDYLSNTIGYDDFQKEVTDLINKKSKMTKLIQFVRDMKELCDELATMLIQSPQTLFNQFTNTVFSNLDSSLGNEFVSRAREEATTNSIATNVAINESDLPAGKDDNDVPRMYQQALALKENAKNKMDQTLVYGQDAMIVRDAIDQFDLKTYLQSNDDFATQNGINSGLEDLKKNRKIGTTTVPDKMLSYYTASIDYKWAEMQLEAYEQGVEASGLSASYLKGLTKVLKGTGNDRMFDGHRYRKPPNTSFDSCFCGKNVLPSDPDMPNEFAPPSGATPPASGNIPPEAILKPPVITNNDIDCPKQLELTLNEIESILASRGTSNK